MLVQIRFQEPLVRKPHGWLPGGLGGVFPNEVVAHIVDFETLVLKKPVFLELKDDLLLIGWDIAGSKIFVCITTNRIRDISFPQS